MKRIILLVTVFVMCFLVFTLIKTPAAIALDLAAPHLPKQLQLGKASGSLWDGRIMQVRFDGEQLNNVRWKLSGWSLLTGKLVGTVRFGDPRDKTDISGHADFSYGLFNQAVLVKIYDNSTIERFGFITNDDLTKLNINSGKVLVYIPHSLTFSGNVFLVDKKNLTPIDTPSRDVMKMIVSGGVSEVEN